MGIHKLGANVYTIQTPKASAIVTFGNADVAYSSPTNARPGRTEHVVWGEKDGQLARMHQLACESPNKWRLIKTRRDFVIGRGVYTHREQDARAGSPTYFEPERFAEFETFRQQTDWDVRWVKMNFQFAFSGNVFLKYSFSAWGELVDIDVIDAFKIRPRKLRAGEHATSAYLINHNHFGSKTWRSADVVTLPAFDRTDPARFPVAIHHLKEDIPGQDNFGFAEWWATEKWTRVANKIPDFHDAGLENGYNLKYHISIPDDYFQKDGLSDEEQETLKREVLRQMADSLAGIDNTDKAVITFHKSDSSGREIPGVRITPLDNKMSDDAYTKLFNTADRVQASGHGVSPTLAGIDTGGKLGGSGKELEAAANYQQHYMTYVDRLLLLTPLRVAQQVNRWPADMKFDVRNIQLYNYDVTPTAAGSNPNAETADTDAD